MRILLFTREFGLFLSYLLIVFFFCCNNYELKLMTNTLIFVNIFTFFGMLVFLHDVIDSIEILGRNRINLPTDAT